ncbi:long-chain-fatty-acid--CoA ligase [Sporolactobacillus sp. Y61]|uniref:Long-chain-fatty-acid--CoA ligase n=1 Tax=Sporolactobacillus sp. Y61 TaxID=3160863 RepID=A0AAU8ICN1_9BACL
MLHQLFVPDFLRRAVKLFPDKTAVVDQDIRLTYRQFEERVNQLSHLLIDLGVKKGDRVAYLAPNTLQMLEGMFGVNQIGAITVPLNTRLIPSAYAYIINHSGAKVLMVDAELAPLIEPVKNKLKQVEYFILLPSPDQKDRTGWISYEEKLEKYPADLPPVPEMSEMDLATILYTSGTTGLPKGVMHSHRSMYFNALNGCIHVRTTDRDVLLHTLPLFHVNGWGTPFVLTAGGGTHVLIRKIDPGRILELVGKEKVTLACMVPAMINMLLHHPNAKTSPPGHHMKVVVAGSAPPPSYVKLVEDILGWEFIQGYGATETAPLVLITQVKSSMEQGTENLQKLKASAGICMMNMDIRIVDEAGRDVSADGRQMGELIVRGNNIMEGYWQQPEETAKAIKDGWYYTGDMATIDKDGVVAIVDRKKDIIISGGENISSIEVEGVLSRHPAVLEAAVIAVPHEKWGEVPHAVCMLKPGQTATDQELLAFCREHLPSFKTPKSVAFVNQLPRTASGKVRKVDLRQPFWTNR